MISSDASSSLSWSSLDVNVESVPSLRLVVVGDCGVGKSLFISALLHQSGRSSGGSSSDAPLSGLRAKGYTPTIGCEVHVMACSHPKHGDFFVEVLDIGGNPTFQGARAFFYEDCDGIIFLWDASSEATYHSLQLWLDEINQSTATNLINPPGTHNNNAGGSNSPASKFNDRSLPLLMVGNKIDKVGWSRKVELQTSCPEHVFVSSRFLGDYFPFQPFRDFLLDAYSKKHNNGLFLRIAAVRRTGAGEHSSLEEGGGGVGLDFDGDSRLPSSLRHRL